ncbi:tRNA dihydrouridine synthase DusB [Pelistega europaea]|uniref:tRNA-dihydrouridine synthase B n=1 Tax=Pelistega europaea TaxID=106147 RepID=A0A7Y4P6B5_9BURK|nr:tRNA dihydrouridine synthase DusB [Pelistega europaea]NOL49754.1 tRNA dihydrouridine synthase DusB [Pelistega europaea]
MKIGQWTLPNPVFVAPMAGVTDRPFRQLCKRLGAGYAVSEMAASNPALWESVKTSRRVNHDGEIDPIAVQIAGADPEMMAQASVFNIHKGAKIIDINMGCPAKKVCHVASGSALLKNEPLVVDILKAVVDACRPLGVPVTLKTRTGWDKEHKNALRIATLAQDIGISAITLHGRTRADFYQGEAEYDTIKTVKASLSIPVIANGDIDSPQKAKYVLDYTGADAVMIGRAAQGNPWIFQQINHFLAHGEELAPPSYLQMQEVLLEHLHAHYQFYGEYTGVRTARKHIGWYVAQLPEAKAFLAHMNQIDNSADQYCAVESWFNTLIQSEQ